MRHPHRLPAALGGLTVRTVLIVLVVSVLIALAAGGFDGLTEALGSLVPG